MVEKYDDGASMKPAEQARYFREVHAKGIQLAGDGKYCRALGSFEQALKVWTDSSQARFDLAACHDAIGDPKKEISLYKEILQISTNDQDCNGNLVTSFIRMYFRDHGLAWRKMAWEAWKQSLRTNPNQPVLRDYLAKSLEE